TLRYNMAQLPGVIANLGGQAGRLVNAVNQIGQPSDPQSDATAYANGYDAARAVTLAAPIVLSMYGNAELGVGLADFYLNAFSSWQASAEAIYSEEDATGLLQLRTGGPYVPRGPTFEGGLGNVRTLADLNAAENEIVGISEAEKTYGFDANGNAVIA